MAYEIPSQLEYREKIIFGLDVKQLGFAMLFGMIDLVIFFKMPWSITAKAIVMIFPTLLGVGFMYFNLDKYINHFYHWIRFRKTDDIKSFIGVKKIGKYILRDKTKVAVLEITPINFNIKTKDEKDTITRQFMKFMNAIDFPIQILMKTKEIDLDSYLAKLNTPKKYTKLFSAMKTFLKTSITKNQIKDRVFYIIIPERDKLEIQVQICKDWISSLNLKYKQLSKKELEKLVDVKGKLLLNEPNHLSIDDKFHRIIYAHGYPRVVEQGFLDKIITSAGDFDFSLHIHPHDVESMMVNINKQLQKQRADLYSLNLKGISNPTLEIQHSDTRKVLEQLQKGNDKLFDIALYIKCRADSLEELNLTTRKIESTLNSIMIIPKPSTFQMDRGFKSMLPLGLDKLKFRRNVTSKGLSAFFPFTSPFFDTQEGGVWLGNNKNGIPIIKDIFKLSNPNGVILAQSGGGKSFFAKLLISRYLMNDTKVMVIDPQGEYKNLVKKFDGQRIELSRNSDTIINPLDLMGHDYAEKRLALMDLMEVMLGDITGPQRALLDKALTKTYEQAGIDDNPETWDNEPPLLEDLLAILEGMEKNTIQMEKMSLRSMINRLSLYVDGVFRFLNRQTNIDFSNKFVCFDIGDIPKPVKPVIMFLVLEYVYTKMKHDINRKILLIDEAWSLLSRTKDASYIFEIVKTCRKFNMGLLLINQEVEGLLTSDAGRSVLANSAYSFLMKQKPAVISNMSKVFHLSTVERDYLLSASVGEGILIIDNEHYEMKVVASDEEHKTITTNADELLKLNHVKKTPNKPKKVKIDVDVNANFFISSKVSKEEKAYLLKKKYRERTYTNIEGKKKKYLIKPRFNESDGHCLMSYDLYHFIKKYTDKIWLYTTKKPDVVFQIGKKKYAIEVETGKIHNTTVLRKKVSTVKRLYKDNWFFVVGDKNIRSKYNNFGDTYDKRNVKKHLLSILKP